MFEVVGLYNSKFFKFPINLNILFLSVVFFTLHKNHALIKVK